MAHSPILPSNRHIPYKKGGWGYAILTTAAAVGAFLTAYYIHTQTYRHPRDVMMREVYEEPAGAGRHQTAGGATTAAEAAQGTPAAGTTGAEAHEAPGAPAHAPSGPPTDRTKAEPARP